MPKAQPPELKKFMDRKISGALRICFLPRLARGLAYLLGKYDYYFACTAWVGSGAVGPVKYSAEACAHCSTLRPSISLGLDVSPG